MKGCASKVLNGLPKDMQLRGHLFLCGCTGLTALPEGLRAGGSIYYSRETGFKKRDVPEELRKKVNLVYI